jgi:tRNA (guanine37-N1)-methyltransferase
METDPGFRDKFNREVQAYSVLIPQERIKEITKSCPEALLNYPKLSTVLPSSKKGHKSLLLSSIPPQLLEFEQTVETISLTYSNFTYTQVLKELLPIDITIPTGFETVGHIAHFNLLPTQLPYRKLIGQVLLDVKLS